MPRNARLPYSFDRRNRLTERIREEQPALIYHRLRIETEEVINLSLMDACHPSPREDPHAYHDISVSAYLQSDKFISLSTKSLTRSFIFILIGDGLARPFNA